MEAVAEKPLCASCGAEVREGTSFCYACGKPVNAPPAIEEPVVALTEAAPIPSETKADASLEAALESAESHSALVQAAPSGDAANNRIRAARERQAARTAKRKVVRTEWAEPADASGIGLMIVAAVIFVISAVVVVYLEVFK
ncbi:MAG: hypothetical protein UZ17_ACD001001096 [Acidobacteria bacterium OLB17]|nr:MAG: hypothetical protein UZ17_ACD001001096 [Acidobacteria bacterium OLB17]MCZ2391946.1 hypothetical protein [Acidobacteriota bacterium]